VTLETTLCNSKTSYPHHHEFLFTKGNKTCGKCWCCERKNKCLPVPSYNQVAPPSLAGPWQCFRWTAADFAAGAGRGNVGLETNLCQSKANFAAHQEFLFTEGNGTCADCWCCERQNSSPSSAFKTGDVVTIGSVKFPNVYLRVDGSNCKANNFCNCAHVNAQYTAKAWEHWKLISQTDGTYCIVSNQFPNVYLSFDGSKCTSAKGTGCGKVNAIYSTSGSCHGKEAFRFISQGNGTYAIRSDWQPKAYLRLDGNRLTHETVRGEGHVNGQFYNGTIPQGAYEIYNITKTN